MAPAVVRSQPGPSSSDTGASKLSKPPLAIQVQAGPVAGGNEPAPTPPAGRLSVPKLALGRTGLGLAANTEASSSHAPSRLQLASPGGEGAGLRDSQQAPGWVGEADSDASSDEEGAAGEAASRAGNGCTPAALRQAPAGLRVPPGFVWSGDLDEDVARLEAMEVRLEVGDACGGAAWCFTYICCTYGCCSGAAAVPAYALGALQDIRSTAQAAIGP